MLLIETGLIAIALFLAAISPTLGKGLLERAESRLSCLARRRTLAVLSVGVLALVLRAAVLPTEPIPEPIVHDEFGYLLAADTFSHVRLTNPTPPMWEHFETFSVLMKPTYQCFAQPAQGMMLASGKLLLGHPFWGVWLSCGLMCATIMWMLQGWLAPEWALLGGVLAVLRYGVFGYWADSYWGGAMGAIGGALVLGALPRIKQSQRIRDALLMGLGLAILATSRPYEGFVFSLPIAVMLVGWLVGRNAPGLRVTVPRVVIPLTLVLALTVAGLGYYLWRVTGNPFRMPYQIERQTYAVAPYMSWQPVRSEPVYHDPVIRKMYVEEELVGYKFFRSFPGLLLKIYLWWSFFLGPVLTLPFLTLILALPADFSWRHIGRSTLFLMIMLGVCAAAWTLESFYNPHYSAPATGLILLLLVLSLRQLHQWGSRGLFLARAVPLICILSFTARTFAVPLHIPVRDFFSFSWYQKPPPSFGRSAIEKQLRGDSGKHLVFVHYAPDHEPFAEWVYNESDLKNARIVWAREKERTSNHQLIDALPDRSVWRLDADTKPPQLLPYSPTRETHAP